MIKDFILIKQLKNIGKKSSNESFLRSFRFKLQKHIEESPFKNQEFVFANTEIENSFLRNRFRIMPAAGFAALIILISGSGAAWASQNSLPGDVLYPMKKFTENVRLIAAVNSTTKANLEAKFSQERVDEIKGIITKKGADQQSLKIALAGLEENTSRANNIINEKKQRGEDVKDLTENINKIINENKMSLEQALKEGRNSFEEKAGDIKAKLNDAEQNGDSAEINNLNNQLNSIQNQINILNQNQGESEGIFENEENKTAPIIDLKNTSEKTIENAVQEKQSILDELTNKNIIPPTGLFSEFDNLITQASSSLANGKYEEALQYAKEAESNLSRARDTIKNLKNIRKNIDDNRDENNSHDKFDYKNNEGNDKLGNILNNIYGTSKDNAASPLRNNDGNKIEQDGQSKNELKNNYERKESDD